MHRSLRPAILTAALVLIVHSACAPAATPVPTQTAPTGTLQPTPTNTVEPTLEPLPGWVVVPLESLQQGIPWLPLDRTQIPTLVYYGFSVNMPPFDIPEVRQAFAAALNTNLLTTFYARGPFYNNEVAARTMVPAQTLSRNVSGVIGFPYDPDLAKQLLASAGFSDPSTFPETKLLIVYPKGTGYPWAVVNAANEAIRMWQENLGIAVKLDVVALNGGTQQEQQDLILSGQYQLFEHGVMLGVNEPHELFWSMFSPEGASNLTGFNQERVTSLAGSAYTLVNPAERLLIYLELERILSEEELPVIPIMHCTVDMSQ
jgi:ABC-type transport system substrate-binding protein